MNTLTWKTTEHQYMVMPNDLEIIRRVGFTGWQLFLGSLPHPEPVQADPITYRYLIGAASQALGIGLRDITPRERVGRIVLMDITPKRTSDPLFALVLNPPIKARPALRHYASAFEYWDHPSAWITDPKTNPEYRLRLAMAELSAGGGLGFYIQELSYLALQIYALINQARA